MRTSAFRFLLLTGLLNVALCSLLGYNIYVSKNMTWSEARGYCRKYYTDLSSISSQEVSQKIFIIGKEDADAPGSVVFTAVGSLKNGWTGLYKDVNDTWKWSGGTNTLLSDWIPLQEQSIDHNCVVIGDKGFKAVNCDEKFPFYCFQSNLDLVKENKTWEEAMEHCHSLDRELVSLASEPSLNKVLQTSRTASTAHVWTGLRYLGDSWLWADGTSSEYQAWSDGGMPLCPSWSHHCGALSLEEQYMDNWDCADKLNFICYKTFTF